MTQFSFEPKPSNARLLGGRRAPVTGADSGIGQGIAFELAAHGAAVAINHVTDSTVADSMVAAIEGRGGKAVAVSGDVAKEEDVDAAFAPAKEAFGGLDLLVNNAGPRRRLRGTDRRGLEGRQELGV